ncbi:MAG TPA: porin, partial [Gemmataceae bacterium]|nr:porin [Gemmataceae bacterium]
SGMVAVKRPVCLALARPRLGYSMPTSRLLRIGPVAVAALILAGPAAAADAEPRGAAKPYSTAVEHPTPEAAPPPAPSAAKDPPFRIRGRVEADAITVSQDDKSKAIYGNFQNAVGFRRLRLGAEGTAGSQASWIAELDFAGGTVAVKNAFLAIHQLPVLGDVRIGHQLEPFSLEGQAASSWFPFTERSPGYALDPVRSWGVAFFTHAADERLTLQAGAFRSGTDNTGNDLGDGNDMAYTARVTGLPWLDESTEQPWLWLVGAAGSQRSAKNDVVTFNQGPQSSLLESNTDNPLIPFVPNVQVAATGNRLVNLQSALLLGPLSVQAEWTATRIDQIGGRPVVFQGAYVMASYFLTGEARGYDRKTATFTHPRVHSEFLCKDGVAGPGAWELTARLAWLDFDSSNLPLTATGLETGSRLTTVTLGVNWYLSDTARIMVNYVRAVPTDPNFGSSTADAITVRTAFFW